MTTLLKSFFSKPGFFTTPLDAERADDCERLHAASFAYPWSKHDFESYLTDKHVVADGSVSGQELIGFILSRVTPPDSEVLTFAVSPARRREGVGKSLLDWHLTTVERLGARLIFLEVGDDNAAALALYDSFGFKVIGRRENYYLRANGERRAALTMRLEL